MNQPGFQWKVVRFFFFVAQICFFLEKTQRAEDLIFNGQEQLGGRHFFGGNPRIIPIGFHCDCKIPQYDLFYQYVIYMSYSKKHNDMSLSHKTINKTCRTKKYEHIVVL